MSHRRGDFMYAMSENGWMDAGVLHLGLSLGLQAHVQMQYQMREQRLRKRVMDNQQWQAHLNYSVLKNEGGKNPTITIIIIMHFYIGTQKKRKVN